MRIIHPLPPGELLKDEFLEPDCETRFRTLAASGDVKCGLDLIDKLDATTQSN